MRRRTFIRSAVATTTVAAAAGAGLQLQATAAGQVPAGAAETALRAATRDALRRATVYMDEVVSYRGGYVWSYLPDLSYQQGEMQANRSMIWIQSPGTPNVGHVYLDAYHATGDERHYRAALRTALAVRAAQRREGGWNYMHDFAGEASLRRWYQTIGANGWRLEEMRRYYGNSTFDDGTTVGAAQFMLRMYLERKDERFGRALDAAIRFIVRSQFPATAGPVAGGWPQRFPHSERSLERLPVPNPDQVPPGARAGMQDGDYTTDATFNDGVLGQNLRFLTLCVYGLGRTDLVPVIEAGMQCLVRLQLPAPQAGWSQQYLSRARDGRPAGAPAGARSHEPRALVPQATMDNIRLLQEFTRLTGDRRYLERIPEAIAWLKSCRLPADAAALDPSLAGKTHPSYVELGTNEPLWVHRYGSNVNNGAYYISKDPRDAMGGGRVIDIARLERDYAAAAAVSDADLAALRARSPLSLRSPRPLPKYFSMREPRYRDMFEGNVAGTPVVTDARAQELVDSLGEKGYWTVPQPQTANPYIGPGPATPHTGSEFIGTMVGDRYDTSPYAPDSPPKAAPYVPVTPRPAISTPDWVDFMGQLISYLEPIASVPPPPTPSPTPSPSSPSPSSPNP